QTVARPAGLLRRRSDAQASRLSHACPGGSNQLLTKTSGVILMSKRTNLTPLLFALLLSSAVSVPARAALSHASFGFRLARALVFAATDREQDGLAGPVRRVKTETAKITVKNGKPAEGPRNEIGRASCR